MGGYWVFPGGRVDPEDEQSNAPSDELTTARYAATREALEEAGVRLNPDSLHPICQWTTPASSPIRFATWFFAAATNLDVIKIDGVEIHLNSQIKKSDFSKTEIGIRPEFVSFDKKGIPAKFTKFE